MYSPVDLRPVARSHQTIAYDLLFRASATATQLLAQDPRFVGGQPDLTATFTWEGIQPSGQNTEQFTFPAS